MTLTIGRIGRAAFIALVFLAGVVPVARAQAPTDAFVVAVPDRYPAAEGLGFIVRSGDGTQKDLIIMNASTLDEPALIAAVELLERLRRKGAVPPGATQVTIVQGLAARGDGPRRDPALDRALATLRSGPRARIGNVGPGRWLELRLDELR